MQIRCPHCSQILETPSVAPGQQVCCPVCNNCFYPPQQQQPQQCHYCGGQNDPGAANCQYCGAAAAAAPQQNNFYQRSHSSDDSFVEDVTFGTPWQKMFVFTGRSCRKEYWFYVLATFIINIISSFLPPVVQSIIAIVMFVVGILYGLPLYVRRCHDLGLSGWWLLLIGWNCAGILLGFWPSQPGANQYGQNPVGISNGGMQANNTAAKITLIILAVLSILFWIILMLVLFTALSGAYNAGARCTSNLKLAILGVHMYAIDNDDYMPDNLQSLENNYYLANDCLYCVSSNDEYTYLGKGITLYSIADADKFPVIIDSGSHDNDIIVAFADGHVETITMPYKMYTATEVVEEIYPDAEYSKNGIKLLENASDADWQY